jgi:hypothetical protein
LRAGQGAGAVRAAQANRASHLKAVNHYFAIYHNLMPAAPWGVAVERAMGTPKTELLMLCRTEKDAVHYANLTNLGHGLKIQPLIIC